MSRGVGRGIVRSLLQTGATVYASGRSIDAAELDDAVVRVPCDHTDDDAAGRLFERMASEHGLLADIQESVAMGPIVTIVPAGSVVQ